MRLEIPKRIEAEILFVNRHTCCLCHERNKDVQIHHIDGDSSNNSTTNLCVLCLDCHSKVTGRRGLGRGFFPLEVKRYKREWETLNRRFNLPQTQSRRQIPKLEKQLFDFEIKRIVYQALAAKDSDRESLERTFELLEHISIMEGMNRTIIDQLQNAFALSAISEMNKPIALARALPRYFLYLVGPTYVEMSRQEEENMIEALETIGFMHNLCIDQNKRASLLRAFKSSVGEFIEMAITYENKRVFRKALSVLKDVQHGCAKVFYKGDRRMPALSREIGTFLDDVRKEALRARLHWKV